MQTNNVIEVVVGLVDKITAPLNRITGMVGKLGALGTVALGGWTLNKFIANINEAEQVALKLDVAFRNVGKASGVTRDQLDDLATELQRTTTISDEQVKSAEALLLTFTRVRGEMFERAIRTAADLSAFMGTDIAQATRMIGFAMQDPAVGMMMLRRARISLTAAERESIKTLAELGDIYGAQAKLLDVVAAKTRGLAEAQRNTLAGAFTALQNHIGDLLEGDRGSFKGAIAAINNFSKALQDPLLKEGIDALIAFLVDSIGLLAKAAAGWANLAVGIAAAIKSNAEGLARSMVGSDDVITRMGEHIRENLEAQSELKRSIIANEQLLASGEPRGRNVAARRLVEQRAELEKLILVGKELQRQRAYELEQRHRLLVGGENQAKAAAKAAQEAAALGFDPDAVAERFLASQKAMRSEVAKTVDEVRGEIQVIANLHQLSDEALAERGIKRSDLDTQVAALQKRVDAAIKNAAGEGIVIPVALQAGQLQEAQDELRALLGAWERETRTAREQALAEWRDYSNKLAELLAAGPAAGGISFEQFAARIKEAGGRALDTLAAFPGASAAVLDALRKWREEGRLTQEQFEQLDLLSEVKITVPRIELPPVEDLMAPFRRRMAENLQDAFADAFMNIGKGWEGTVQAFLDGFRRILAEAAAMRLARFFELDKIVAGAPTKGWLGKVIGTILPPARPKLTPAVAGAAQRYDQATGAAPGGGAECAAQCASGVVEKVAATIAAPVKESTSGILALLKSVTGGLWKTITGMLGKLWDFIKAAIAAIRAMASGSGGSSSGGIIAGIVSVVGAFFGASAGGGRAKGGQPRKVGEEGPEWIVPEVDATVVNERQVQFAGAGLIAALGLLTSGIEAAAKDLSAIPAPRIEAPEAQPSRAAAPEINVTTSAPRVTVPQAKITIPRAPEVRVPAPEITLPRMEPLPREAPRSSAAPVTLNFSPVYQFTLNGEAAKDGKVDPRLLAYIERRDQQNKVEIMEMLKRNGFGRMTR